MMIKKIGATSTWKIVSAGVYMHGICWKFQKFDIFWLQVGIDGI